MYATFLGGSGYDAAAGIAVDTGGNVYLTGFTQSSIFPGIGGNAIQPLNGGAGDAFVVKVNAAGTAMVYATFLGGSGNDQGSGIAVDAAGASYVVGFTASSSFPGVGPGSLQPPSMAVEPASSPRSIRRAPPSSTPPTSAAAPAPIRRTLSLSTAPASPM